MCPTREQCRPFHEATGETRPERAASFPVAELDYDLPERLIAQVPAERRTDSRLLVLDRETGDIQDRRFSELPELLGPADLLVLNNTQVLPAKFRLRRRTGGRIDGLFLHEHEAGVWEVLLRNASRLKPNEALDLDGPGPSRVARFRVARSSGAAGGGVAGPCSGPQESDHGPGTILTDGSGTVPPALTESSDLAGQTAEKSWSVCLMENLGQGRWVIRMEPADAAVDVLAHVGRTPLPPYIRRRSDADAHDRDDAERYQTVYASQPGAVAAPTAGLHFTQAMLEELAGRGIQRVELTLHVGIGTFAPVTVDDLAQHPMHAEWYQIEPAAAEHLDRHRAAGGRIVAVGTTSVRVLESCVDAAGRFLPGSGWTRTFCYPPYVFRRVDVLLTNFHLPRSTLLALVMAFAGVERIREAYRHAVAREYRFFSFGDATLIR